MILTEYDEKKHLRNIREEGIEKINKLNCLLIEANRNDCYWQSFFLSRI